MGPERLKLHQLLRFAETSFAIALPFIGPALLGTAGTFASAEPFVGI